LVGHKRRNEGGDNELKILQRITLKAQKKKLDQGIKG
jgi:hypothetical protein